MSDDDEPTCDACGRATHPKKRLTCESCATTLHIFCVEPPVSAAGEDAWICPSCTSLRRSDELYKECALVEVDWDEYGPVIGEVQGVREGDGDETTEHLVWYAPGDEHWHALHSMIDSGDARLLEADRAHADACERDELVASRARIVVRFEEVKINRKVVVVAGWYSGTVAAARVNTRDCPRHAGRTLHLVCFDAGDRHWIDLSSKATKWAVDERSQPVRAQAAKAQVAGGTARPTGHKATSTSERRAAAAAAAERAAEEKRRRDELKYAQSGALGSGSSGSAGQYERGSPSGRAPLAPSRPDAAAAADATLDRVMAARNQLEMALGAGSDAVAVELEAAIRELAGANGGGGRDGSAAKAYAKAVRTLAANLSRRDNETLRAKVLSRELPPARLVRMAPAELASAAQRKELTLHKQASLQSVIMPEDEGATGFVSLFGSLVPAKRQADHESAASPLASPLSSPLGSGSPGVDRPPHQSARKRPRDSLAAASSNADECGLSSPSSGSGSSHR